MNTLTNMFKRKAEKKCPFCGKDMSTATRESFTDERSYKEFTISGLCQECQDRTFG